MNNTCLIVIVTYNRLNDLKKSIECAMSQTYSSKEILVVNNGSTDGTREYLDLLEGVLVIHQDNVGGAGGFYSGMKYMYDHDYEWLLMMDDDGLPDKNELEQLMTNYDRAKEFNHGNDCIVNALVINKDQSEELAFSWGVNSKQSIKSSDYSSDMLFHGIHPFNGTLVKRSIIEKIGFIKKELFIWGDEEEYMLRAKANGFGTVTICSAIHRHPKEKGEKGFLLPFCKSLYIIKKPQKMSHIFYRNKAYNYSHYMEKRGLLWKFFICHFYYNLIRFRIDEIVKLCKYYRRGIIADFN